MGGCLTRWVTGNFVREMGVGGGFNVCWDEREEGELRGIAGWCGSGPGAQTRGCGEPLRMHNESSWKLWVVKQ